MFLILEESKQKLSFVLNSDKILAMYAFGEDKKETVIYLEAGSNPPEITVTNSLGEICEQLDHG